MSRQNRQRSPEYKAKKAAWYQEKKNDPKFKAREHERYLRGKTDPKRKAQVKAATLRWQAKQPPEKVAAIKAAMRLRRARYVRVKLGNKVKQVKSPRRGPDLSLVQYMSALVHQDQRCMICRRAFDEIARKVNPRAIDHDHKTNKIRGILCNNCNLILGHAKDNPVVLMSAARYLENHGC